MRLIDLIRPLDETAHLLLYDTATQNKFETNKYNIDRRDLYKFVKSLYVENSTLIVNLESYRNDR